MSDHQTQLQVCVCGWSKVTSWRGLRTHQGIKKCLDRVHGTRIGQYTIQNSSSQPGEVQRQFTYHSSQDSSTSVTMEQLQVCVCGWSKVTSLKGLRIHQGKMKCLDRVQGTCTGQYITQNSSSQSAVQQQKMHHSSQEINTSITMENLYTSGDWTGYTTASHTPRAPPTLLGFIPGIRPAAKISSSTSEDPSSVSKVPHKDWVNSRASPVLETGAPTGRTHQTPNIQRPESGLKPQPQYPLDNMPVHHWVEMNDTETVRPDLLWDAGAASHFQGHMEMPGALAPLILPPFQYWYLSQAYQQELQQITKEFGVQIKAETSVSICAEKERERRESETDSVRRATQAFSELVEKMISNHKPVLVPHAHMEGIMKEVLRIIPEQENRITLNMTANEYQLSGPEHITSQVEDWLNSESAGKNSGSVGENESPNTDTKLSVGSADKPPMILDMDITDTQAAVEMDESHFHLMKTVFQKHLSEIQDKYEVQFYDVPLQGSMKVSAQSSGTHQLNLEAHALTALTHLYRKLVTSAITCHIKDDSYTEKVSQAFQRIRSQHPFVGEGQKKGHWKLFGLPKHLILAINDLEKMIGHPVVDAESKQLLGNPEASGFQTGMDGMRGAHGGDVRDGKEASDQKTSQNGKEKDSEDKCPICLDTFTEKKKLQCGHEFCSECQKNLIKSGGEICPLCKKIFRIIQGNQPNGNMRIRRLRSELPGFPQCGTIEIHYTITGGIQTSEHPHPGKRFHGAHHTAYLPNNKEGNHVLSLLRRAFDQKLIFTVGFSRTTGADDVVTWVDIHHKISRHGGPEAYGYPDPHYLNRVKEELKAKGIE